jgi:hypothetical protein
VLQHDRRATILIGGTAVVLAPVPIVPCVPKFQVVNSPKYNWNTGTLERFELPARGAPRSTGDVRYS